MGITIKPKFTIAQIQKLVGDKLEKFEGAALSRLQFVGEKFVTNARNNGNYKDHTGNLRSSVGYIILKDGEQITGNFVKFPKVDPAAVQTAADGITSGKDLADEVAGQLRNKFPRGLILIVVAGMDYAAAVESKGYDVLSASGIQAEADLKAGFEQLAEKIGKIL